MATGTQNSNRKCPATLQELLEDKSGKYKHLQVIMHKNGSNAWGFDQEYLLVNSNGFAVYRLENIEYSDGLILVTLSTPSTGEEVEIRLDINNEKPEHFLISWNDVRDMVYTHNYDSDGFDSCDTLELEIQ